MIQRPQTLYLLTAAILNLGIFWTRLYSQAVADPSVWIGYGFALSLTIALLIAIVSIFLYNNRIFQLKIVKFGTYIQIVALGFSTGILFSMGGFGTYLWRESLGVLLIAFSLLMYWLGGRSIKKDEELVKSMDRIR